MSNTNVIKKRGIVQQFCQNYGIELFIALTMFALIFGFVGCVLRTEYNDIGKVLINTSLILFQILIVFSFVLFCVNFYKTNSMHKLQHGFLFGQEEKISDLQEFITKFALYTYGSIEVNTEADRVKLITNLDGTYSGSLTQGFREYLYLNYKTVEYDDLAAMLKQVNVEGKWMEKRSEEHA